MWSPDRAQEISHLGQDGAARYYLCSVTVTVVPRSLCLHMRRPEMTSLVAAVELEGAKMQLVVHIPLCYCLLSCYAVNAASSFLGPGLDIG